MTAKEFFKWWYTNSHGHEYMNFTDCALSHNWVVISTTILSAAVLIIYCLIAFNSYQKAKHYPKSITKSYLLNKMNVFLFCGLTGYGYTILSVFINPYKLRVVLLLALAVMAFKFYQSMIKTNIIDRILDKEAAFNKRLMNYNKLAMQFQKDSPQIVTWKTLQKFKTGYWEEIDRIKFMKMEESKNTMIFLTEMDVNSRFGKHSHDCLETVEILSGELIDDLNGLHMTHGEKFTYRANQIHAPYTKVKSTYKVTFKNIET